MPNDSIGRMKRQMFALSFTALFLELMVIRWVPAVVPFIAYYANLMLLSSFLGLGVGAMTARRNWRLFEQFPVFLACGVATLVLCRNVILGASADEARFTTLDHTLLNTLVLIWIFASNALLFVPIGQRMGVLFNSLPRLTAYAWDLAGSLFGTLSFGLFSLTHFSPFWGMAFVMVVYLVMSDRSRWALTLPTFAAILMVILLQSDRAAIWSPYHYITVSRIETPNIMESDPPKDLLTMVNPPVYSVGINHVFYHYDAAFDRARYSNESRIGSAFIVPWRNYFRLPYALSKGRNRALILGAGGGGDVQAALQAGVRSVDAVDIDPVVIEVARRFSAGAPYSDPRVSVHIDDARSYLAKARPGYDLVVFGLLDSHAMFSSMTTVRLDGYVYTIEGMRSAYGLLSDDGMLFVSFSAIKDWMGPKLYQMLAEATGREPAMYMVGTTVILCVSKNLQMEYPKAIAQFRRFQFLTGDFKRVMSQVDIPSDDWPFLYLVKKTIPQDYLVAIGCLLAFSVGSVASLRRHCFGGGDLHFALLGMGFLLLETKSIGDCTLYFGATWLVTMIVVAGVLLMVMAANLVAERVKQFSLWMYVPLFIALAILLIVPRAQILDFAFSTRLLWTLLVVPLPVFFAGIIFSTTFRLSVDPSGVFGANLIGAMIGGFCEYLTMAVGSYRLSMLLIAAYLASMLTLYIARRRGHLI